MTIVQDFLKVFVIDRPDFYRLDISFLVCIIHTKLSHRRGKGYKMAESVLVQSKVRLEQKEQAEKIFNRAGLSMGDAIRLFLQQTINADDIPFTITAKRPSARLRQAMQESLSNDGKVYDTPDLMFAEWEKHDV